jgi:truncated hemoglobin YjbI
MGHNVWSHINAVQEANRQYDAGVIPKMLVQEQFDRVLFRDVMEEIFSKSTKEESLEIIEKYTKFWMAIPGTRGAIGKKTVNASTHFNALFDVEEPTVDEDTLDETKLEDLEDEQL